MQTRSLSLMALLMIGVALPAYAQNGMHKHDNSIATYDYNIEIKTGEVGGAGSSLEQEIDNGAVQDGVLTKQNTGGGVQPLQMPQEAASILQVGSTAPNFQLAAGNGQVVTLQDIVANAPAVILFAKGNSGMQAMQLLQKNQQQFKQLGIHVVAVSSEPLDSIARGAKARGITYPVLSDANGYATQQYGVGSAPVLYTIAQGGQIAAVQVQSSGSMLFDLSEATLPVRPQQAVAAPAPQAKQAAPQAAGRSSATTAPMGNTATPGQQGSQPATQNTGSAAQGNSMQGSSSSMPSMPSPQSPGFVPEASGAAPRVNFVLPPSHPDYKKAQLAGLSI